MRAVVTVMFGVCNSATLLELFLYMSVSVQ
jgi:hypothetical protein